MRAEQLTIKVPNRLLLGRILFHDFSSLSDHGMVFLRHHSIPVHWSLNRPLLLIDNNDRGAHAPQHVSRLVPPFGQTVPKTACVIMRWR